LKSWKGIRKDYFTFPETDSKSSSLSSCHIGRIKTKRGKRKVANLVGLFYELRKITEQFREDNFKV